MTRDDLDDQVLLASLRRIAAATDHPPDDVWVAARAAILTRGLDDRIATLIGDSRVVGESTGYEAVRGPGDPGRAPWLLSFAGGGVQIDMEVDGVRTPIRLIGQLSGAGVDDCFLETRSERRPIDVDSAGRFVVDDLGHGPIRLCCRSESGQSVTTSWIRI